MEIDLIKEETQFEMIHVTFNLRFDNRAFTQACLSMTRDEKHLPISANVLFEIFPFCIVYRFVNLQLVRISDLENSRNRNLFN